MTGRAGTLRVLHGMHEWLAPTQPWIGTQIENLPGSVESRIAARLRTERARAPVRVMAWHRNGPRDAARRRQAPGRYEAGYQRWFAKAVRRTGPDLVHSHFGDAAWDHAQAMQGRNLPHVATFYGFDASRLPTVTSVWQERYAWLFEHVAGVWCEGPAMAAKILGLGCPRDRVVVHHFGIEVDRIPFRPRRRPEVGPLRVLIAAGFREKKGIPDALEAVAALRDEGVDVHVDIVGGSRQAARSQDEGRRILATIDRCRLGPHVTMHGFLPWEGLMELAEQAHVFLAPSRTARDGDDEGGAPVSVLQMAASGMPVVSTRHCDIPYILEEGVSGLLADEGDVAGLTRHLRWLFDDADRWTPLVLAARKRMERHFDASNRAAEAARRYRHIVQAGGRAGGRAA